MLRSGAALVLAVAAMAGPSAAQEIVNPTWASIPDAEAMGDAYPEFAAMIAQEGDVNLRCRVAPDGTLSLCRVDYAVPEGLGFDRAALTLTPLFRANPREVDGEVTKSDVQFTIRFRPGPDEEAPPPWVGPEPSREQLAAAANVLAKMMGPELRAAVTEELATMDLDVSADRESRVREMLLQVDAEFLEREEQAAVLALARLMTPEQLAAIPAGGDWPPRPSDEQLASAGDVAYRTGEQRYERLRRIYCAEFECPDLTPPPPF